MAPNPTIILKHFTRACGHQEAMIWTVDDLKQANRYQATRCTSCGEPSITFARGWGRSR